MAGELGKVTLLLGFDVLLHFRWLHAELYFDTGCPGFYLVCLMRSSPQSRR